VTPELLRDVYAVEAVVLTHPGTGRPVLALDLPGDQRPAVLLSSSSSSEGLR
jgi:hypothetical protein